MHNILLRVRFDKVIGTKRRNVSIGQFGAHIGAAPIVKLQPDMEADYDGIYETASLNKGELGHMMAEYIYWVAPC